jgi:chemotaxis protein methyltransferase CheR
MIFSALPSIPMSDDEFALLRDLIHNYSGLYFDDDNRFILEKRLADRLDTHHLTCFRDYYYYLKYDRNRDQEMSDLMEVLTTNETYFFRENFQLQAFATEIVPELIAAKQPSGDRTLRIWSAGCSTGEEPYTIAMLLREMPQLRGWRLEIVGTDISQRVLQQARKGVYGKSSFRVTDEYFRKRYFAEENGGYRIADTVRELITFSQLNLFDALRCAFLGKMDIVFCRNVIIYFDMAAKKKVIEQFHTTLYNNGFLLLGHSESLMNITTAFRLRHFKHDMVYQKALPGQGGIP